MPAYMVADVEWHDEAALKKYVEGHSELLAKFGGEILAASKDIDIVEGDWKFRQLVIFKFPSKKNFRAWYTSKEYAPRLALRLKHADGKIAVIGDPE